jgi:protocatechuate 3,4-dioxygenase beta subunit
VIIAGLGTAVTPAVFAALPTVEEPQRLVLSGRVIGPDAKPLAGATVAAGQARTATDADGRFVLVTSSPHYRVSYRARSTAGFVSVSDRRPDGEGSWRASIGLTLA